ncbi:Homoserine kinase ThrB [Methanonatronarchaeum thermophilum]|uniref:Homoserine kinase n=1 Tax=Methanonatronarchaeum thermophilum TaxID=1927129 RepID=A0A1Y3GIL4_9EURY|nr:homoserine kinase [Methanonatronarchaeum thermophilum]OUJ19275.1 Homoserine kinase ThrB [Methanonatronarchaeum thermophilum]
MEVIDIDRITVKAPATVANMGPGYDVFGLAVRRPFDRVTVKKSSETEITINGVGSGDIPTDPEHNTAGVVAQKMLPDQSVHIELHKGIPPGSGLGSSAASAAATAVAINKLFNLNHTTNELINIAAQGEEVAAGETHSDNVGPAITGGFCTIKPNNNQINQITPKPFKITLVIPEHTSKTREARKQIPRKITLNQAKQNIYHASLITQGIIEGDIEKIGQGMHDTIAEPIRAKTIPGYKNAKKQALKTGAHGCTISGSGPTTIAVGPNPKKIGKQIQKAYKQKNINSKLIITKPGKGTQTLKTKT